MSETHSRGTPRSIEKEWRRAFLSGVRVEYSKVLKPCQRRFKETPIHLPIMTRIHTLSNYYYYIIIMTTCSFTWILVNYRHHHHWQQLRRMNSGSLIETTNAMLQRVSEGEAKDRFSYRPNLVTRTLSQFQHADNSAGAKDASTTMSTVGKSNRPTRSSADRVMETGRGDLIKHCVAPRWQSDLEPIIDHLIVGRQWENKSLSDQTNKQN